MIEKFIRTLLHPRLMMTSFAMLALYAGVSTLAYEATFIHFPYVWGTAGLLAGLLVVAAAAYPGRAMAAVSGAAFMVIASARSLALVEAMITLEQPSSSVTAQLGVSAAQWITTAYISWVIWNRQVIPWSVVCQEDRQYARSRRV